LGFRALAHIDRHHCALVSRNGHTFKHWPQLCEELAHAVKAHDAVIDGEIVCLDARAGATSRACCSGASGPTSTRSICSQWTAKTWEWPLLERKRRLRRLIPSVPTRLLYVDHV
jgi:ATP-dependent DNA ligase